MHKKLALSLTTVCITLLGTSISGCLSVDDFIKIEQQEAPEPSKPVNPETPQDPDDPAEEQNNPSGSGGVTPSTPEDSESNPEDGDTSQGGQITIPETLSLELISPSSGDFRGGYEVRVHGKVLDKTGTVQFGSIASPSQIYVNSNVVRAVVPEGKPGCVDVFWTQGDETLTLKDGFCYTEDIDITSVAPDKAAVNTAVEIEISGSGFDETTHAFVKDSSGTSLPLADMHVVSSTKITGLLPVLKPGKASISVIDSDGRDELIDALELLPQIGIDTIEPAVVQAMKSEQIVIAGTGFIDDTIFRIGGQTAAVSEISSSSAVITAPPLAAGSYDLVAMDSWRQIRLDKAIHYYEDTGEPQIIAAVPNTGITQGGSTVEILGKDLPIYGSSFFDTSGAAILARSNHKWLVETPAHEAGIVNISVGKYKLKNGFTYIRGEDGFSASSITPGHAVVSDDTTVEIVGAGFNERLQVSFGPWMSEQVTVKDSSHAVVKVPKGVGTVPVQLSQGLQSAQLSFTYDENVAVTGITPDQSVLTGSTLIEIHGTGFTPDMAVVIDGKEYETTYVSPGLITFSAPAHEVGTDTVSVKCSDGSVCAETELTWFNPSGINTSASGGKINGELHVTVLTVETAVPIPNATVYIGTDLDSSITGKTDENGRVSFFDSRLVDAQIIVACAPEHSCNTIQPINASNITLFLEDWHANDSSGESSDIDMTPPTPSDGDIINPIVVTMPYEPQDPYFKGTVGSFGKVELVSNPNLVKAGLVMQSALSPYMMSYSRDDVYLILEEGGEYSIKARKGDVALALVCGLYNKDTGGFQPKYIGVKRHQFVNDGSIIENHLECPIPLNQKQPVKLLDAPLHSGPNVVHATSYLFFGSEGYLGGFMTGTSDTDYVVVTQMPPLVDELSEATFAFTVGAYTDMASPSTVFNEYNVIPSEQTLEVGPAAPIPVFHTQETEDILKTGNIQWSVEYPQNVDFYSLVIRSYSSAGANLLYQFYLPGNATSAEFPTIYQWKEDKSEQLYISLTAYKSVREGFDFNRFTTGDTRWNYIHSSASSSLIIREPDNQK